MTADSFFALAFILEIDRNNCCFQLEPLCDEHNLDFLCNSLVGHKPLQCQSK